MSEAKTESTTTPLTELRGDSRLLVLLGTPEGIRSTSKKLSGISDFTRVRRGLFIAHSFSPTQIELLHEIPHISFMRTRAIPGIKHQTSDMFADRVFSIISYTFTNPTSSQKKKVERLLRKSIGIRLRPSILLFPMLKSKERRKLLETETGQILFDSRGFVNHLNAMGATSIRWSRIKLANPADSALISTAVEKTMRKDLLSLENMILDLREQSKDPDVTTSRLRRKFSLLTRRYKLLKVKWLTTKPIWSYDSTKPIKRLYNMLLTLRRALESR